MFSAELISLLGQVPILGIFIVFILIWSDRSTKSLETRSEAWRQAIKTNAESLTSSLAMRDKQMQDFQKSRDNILITFLAEQRVHDREILGQLVESVNEVSTILSNHDKFTTTYLTKLDEQTKDRKNDG